MKHQHLFDSSQEYIEFRKFEAEQQALAEEAALQADIDKDNIVPIICHCDPCNDCGFCDAFDPDPLDPYDDPSYKAAEGLHNHTGDGLLF